METLFCSFILLAVFWLLWRGVIWMLRVGRDNALKSEPLTPADLRVLEETAARLMAELKATADECVAKIEAACARACSAGDVWEASSRPERKNLIDWADTTASASEVAKQTGLTIGEIELMRSLRSCRSANKEGSADCEPGSKSESIICRSDS
ncbi:MAG: hypothetical protein QHI38_09270 [Armatimonadota bacterium]|nr:hypothetical protein [Armatimonadota bacterium]